MPVSSKGINRKGTQTAPAVARKYSIITFACLLLSSSLAHSANPENIIKYRQSVMLSQRAHMAAATAIIKGKVPFTNQLMAHAKALQAMNQDIPQLFPKGSHIGDKTKTKALPELWEQKEEFVKKAKDAKEKSEILVRTIESGDEENYAPRLKDLLDACKSCHKKFRKKNKKK